MTINILIYRGKHGDQYWLVDTPPRLAAAKHVLFQQLDQSLCYEDDVPADQLTAARAGDPYAIRDILDDHNGYEYEEWDIESVESIEVIPTPLPTRPPPATASIPSRPDLRSFDIYQRAAYGTATYPPEQAIWYPTLGLGEAGEVANQVKKIYRDDGGVLTEERKARIKKELGDVLWYMAAIATDIGVSLTDIAADNLAKLYARKDRGTICGAGDER